MRHHGRQVSNTPNRVGAICLAGSACPNNTNRELLDLFQVAEDPLTVKAAVIYTDSTKGDAPRYGAGPVGPGG